jgi:hypothetical protein
MKHALPTVLFLSALEAATSQLTGELTWIDLEQLR